jgi:hypothetical protein
MVLLILGLCLSINAMLFSIVTGTHIYICIARIVSTFCGTIDKSTTWFKARIPNLETLPTWIEPKWLLQSCWHLDCLLCWIHIQKDSLCTCHILWFLMIFCRIADVSLKEAKMSEGALKSNYSKASITQMAWTTARTETDYTSRLSHLRVTWVAWGIKKNYSRTQ